MPDWFQTKGNQDKPIDWAELPVEALAFSAVH
jgi:hypothetical protein